MQADKLYGVIYKFIYLFNVKKNCNKNENQLLFQLTKMGFVIVIKAFHFRTFHRISPIYAIQIQIPAFFFFTLILPVIKITVFSMFVWNPYIQGNDVNLILKQQKEMHKHYPLLTRLTYLVKSKSIETN